MIQTKKILKKYWSYDSFRPLQEEIISSILDEQNTIALLATGGGKSLCFQVPTMMKDGMCLVISPLIALMNDQVSNLVDKNIAAYTLNSSLSFADQNRIIDKCREGEVKFLYVSPEKLLNKDFREILQSFPISLLAIDEAHCISQWGYDFRPSYLQIPEIYNFINNPPVIALTATATEKVLGDIAEKLDLGKSVTFKSSFRRENIGIHILKTENKVDKLKKTIQQLKGLGLVYVNSRKKAMEVSEILNNSKLKADYYHAGLSTELRNSKQEKWSESSEGTMVCTNAFGMGIDQPNVRYVIHYDFPDNLESYYQEIGRAGRNGSNSFAIALVSEYDIEEKKQAIEKFPTEKELKDVLTLLFNFYKLPFESGRYEVFDFDFERFIETNKLGAYQTKQCIQFLEDSECIRVQGQFFKPATLKIFEDERALNNLKEEKYDYYHLINNLRRSYDNLTFGTQINLYRIAKKYNYNIQDLKNMLELLNDWEIIEYKDANQNATIEFLIDKRPKNEIPIDTSYLSERKKIKQIQINKTIEFIDNKTQCRAVLVTEYFGENDDKACGVCDICKQNTQSSEDKNKIYFDIKNNIEKLLSSNELSLNEILYKLNQYPQQKVRKVLDRLLELNKVKVKGGKFVK